MHSATFLLAVVFALAGMAHYLYGDVVSANVFWVCTIILAGLVPALRSPPPRSPIAVRRGAHPRPRRLVRPASQVVAPPNLIPCLKKGRSHHEAESAIKSDVIALVAADSLASGQWYVGVSADARRRLFTVHRVRQEGDAWIIRLAPSLDVARRVQAFFLGMGCDGGSSDDEGCEIYAYRKAPHTCP